MFEVNVQINVKILPLDHDPHMDPDQDPDTKQC